MRAAPAPRRPSHSVVRLLAGEDRHRRHADVRNDVAHFLACRGGGDDGDGATIWPRAHRTRRPRRRRARGAVGPVAIHLRLARAAEGHTVTAAGRSYLINLLGTAWLAVMQIAFAPFFIRLIGIEGYGLIGFSVTLQAVLQVLDFAFAP